MKWQAYSLWVKTKQQNQNKNLWDFMILVFLVWMIVCTCITFLCTREYLCWFCGVINDNKKLPAATDDTFYLGWHTQASSNSFSISINICPFLNYYRRCLCGGLRLTSHILQENVHVHVKFGGAWAARWRMQHRPSQAYGRQCWTLAGECDYKVNGYKPRCMVTVTPNLRLPSRSFSI